jgi:hypothetical protein
MHLWRPSKNESITEAVRARGQGALTMRVLLLFAAAIAASGQPTGGGGIIAAAPYVQIVAESTHANAAQTATFLVSYQFAPDGAGLTAAACSFGTTASLISITVVNPQKFRVVAEPLLGRDVTLTIPPSAYTYAGTASTAATPVTIPYAPDILLTATVGSHDCKCVVPSAAAAWAHRAAAAATP